MQERTKLRVEERGPAGGGKGNGGKERNKNKKKGYIWECCAQTTDARDGLRKKNTEPKLQTNTKKANERNTNDRWAKIKLKKT